MKDGSGEDPFADPVEDTSTDDDVQETTETVPQEDVGDFAVQGEQSMADAIAGALGDVEAGEAKNTIGFRHDELKSVLLAMDESPALREQLAALCEAAGISVDEDGPEPSDVVRAAMLAGLHAEAPDVLAAVDEAKQQQQSLGNRFS